MQAYVKISCVELRIVRFYIYIYHQDSALQAQTSLTHSCHKPLSPITLWMSFRLHSLSAQSWCIKVLASCHKFARPCEGFRKCILLMNSSLLLQLCPAYLVSLTWIVSVMGCKWPYGCCFEGCCLQELLNTAGSVLALLLSTFFSTCLVTVNVVHPYSSIDTTAS